MAFKHEKFNWEAIQDRITRDYDKEDTHFTIHII